MENNSFVQPHGQHRGIAIGTSKPAHDTKPRSLFNCGGSGTSGGLGWSAPGTHCRNCRTDSKSLFINKPWLKSALTCFRPPFPTIANIFSMRLERGTLQCNGWCGTSDQTITPWEKIPEPYQLGNHTLLAAGLAKPLAKPFFVHALKYACR